MTRLQVISDMLRGHVFDLSADRITIGRAADNMICLNHTSVSKHHAVLAIDGDSFTLSDLESTNGTIVNGNRIACTHLTDGDRIVLGEVELRFTLNKKPWTNSISLPVPQTTTASSLLHLFAKGKPKHQAIVPTPPRPKSNGDSATPLTARPLPSRQFAARSSQVLSRLRFRLRASPPFVSLQDANAPDEVVPTVIGTSASMPPIRESLPAPSARHHQKDPELRLKPTPPVAPIKIQKPLSTSLDKPLPVATDRPIGTAKSGHLTSKTPPPPLPPKKTGMTVYAALAVAGLLLLIVGYSGQNDALKFLGFVCLTTGILCAFFRLRFGSLINPPKK